MDRNKHGINLKLFWKISIGFLWILIGFSLFSESCFFEKKQGIFENYWYELYGGICILYGAWRMYRGLMDSKGFTRG